MKTDAKFQLQFWSSVLRDGAFFLPPRSCHFVPSLPFRALFTPGHSCPPSPHHYSLCAPSHQNAAAVERWPRWAHRRLLKLSFFFTKYHFQIGSKRRLVVSEHWNACARTEINGRIMKEVLIRPSPSSIKPTWRSVPVVVAAAASSATAPATGGSAMVHKRLTIG